MPEGTKMRLVVRVEGASPDEVQRGGLAAMDFFAKAGVTPYQAAAASFAREGWDISGLDENYDGYSEDDALIAHLWDDAAVKAAEVWLLEMKLAVGIGGKGYFSLTGELYQIQAAVEAATGAVPGARYNYADPPREILERVARLSAVCQSHGVRLIEAALRFVLGHPVVKTVIPGANSVEQVRGNLALIDTKIPSSLWADLKDQKLVRADAPTDF